MNSLIMRRVVVTGLGLVTPLGDGTEISWKNLIAGESGLAEIKDIDIEDIDARVAAQVKRGENGFELAKYVSIKDQKKMDNFIMFAIAAAQHAMMDSGYEAKTDEQKYRSGVLIGSGIGGLTTIADSVKNAMAKSLRRVSPFFIPASLINLAAGNVSMRYGFQGPNHAVVTACSTGVHAIGDAARMIMLDDADVMIAGAAEAAINPMGMAGFASARALSTSFNDNPKAASRPWDKKRDGFVMGEGAGIVVLEEYEHAKKRGAKIYCEIGGYGMSGDAHHMTAPLPDGNGGFRSMKAALKNANMKPEDIDYINAHGTSTPLGDEAELLAVKKLFGDHISKISMSSTKSSIGHLLGAAGAVEMIFCALSIRDQIVPPTLNLDDPCESAKDIDLVPHKAKKCKLHTALSNSFGFGGTNATIIIKQVA